MVTSAVQAPKSCTIPSFAERLNGPLTKVPITTLQINLGRKCNLACAHCHVEAGPRRTEELSEDACDQLVELIEQFDQIQTVDVTGGAPEMNYGFRPILEAARRRGKKVIVRSNLTIYFVDGFGDLPDYFAKHQAHVVASLPCYLQDNVDKMRGHGVFDDSIKALQWLNRLGYGSDPNLNIDLVYNPPFPMSEDFSLTPDQVGLQAAYKKYLKENFGIVFNQLYAITNLPVGRSKRFFERSGLLNPYLRFLSDNFNGATVPGLMCRSQLSVDYHGNVFDCDFTQMEDMPARDAAGNALKVADFLAAGSLDLIPTVQTDDYCYGCTAGCGSSCGGSLT